MLRKLLILFCGLLVSCVSFAEKATSLHLKPESNSKIIGAIKNTEVMILLEQKGKWARVVDAETGMVGWLIVGDKGAS